MGNKESTITAKETIENITRGSFDFILIIGRGGFGKVWKVLFKKNRLLYAMKEMSKVRIIDKRSEKSIKSERDLLSKMNHPFLINMHYAFQDSDNLYLVMDLLTGGDLRYHLCKYRTFTEEQTKFFMACMILGLDYCHFNNIIHRDIKPENLVLDNKGYLRITDFGIAKIQHPNNARETSGTPGYMSPEVICSQNHTIAVDYFALGVIGYEFMMGVRPYLGRSRKEIKEKIIAKQVRIRPQEIPNEWSPEAADCINSLIQRKATHRLGSHGAKEVKEHAWFQNYPWKDLYEGNIQAPFTPKISDNFDHKYCNAMEKQGIKTQERYIGILQSDNYKSVFDNYSYFNIDDALHLSNKIKESFINHHDASYIKNHHHKKIYSYTSTNTNTNSNTKKLMNSTSTNNFPSLSSKIQNEESNCSSNVNGDGDDKGNGSDKGNDNANSKPYIKMCYSHSLSGFNSIGHISNTTNFNSNK